MLTRIFSFIIPVFCFCLVASANDKQRHVADTAAMDAIVQRYAEQLVALATGVDGERRDSTVGYNRYNPYFYRLLAPGTLYRAPMQQEFAISWKPSLPGRVAGLPGLGTGMDMDRKIMKEENKLLMQTYVNAPWLIKTTESNLEEAGFIREEIIPEVPKDPLAVAPERDIDLSSDVDPVQLVVRRPNFWKFKGDYSLQFTQSYFSENWYQGGENNYTMLALVTMEANFNNKQRVQWDNRLEMRLGFQTSKSDELHHIKTNDDLLRFTTKIGYQATKHWFYTLQVQAYTQFYPSYNSNSDVVASDFMSPFNLVVSLGMDYKLELKRFSGSAILSPVAYNFRKVSRPSLYGKFGLEEGRSTYHNFGPNITVKYSWKILSNITWDARIYWFSNLETTDIEWENTFTFSITKYLNTKLFLYPRIDDSSPNYKSEDKGSYFMFKEWFSLGVNYSF